MCKHGVPLPSAPKWCGSVSQVFHCLLSRGSHMVYNGRSIGGGVHRKFHYALPPGYGAAVN